MRQMLFLHLSLPPFTLKRLKTKVIGKLQQAEDTPSFELMWFFRQVHVSNVMESDFVRTSWTKLFVCLTASVRTSWAKLFVCLTASLSSQRTSDSCNVNLPVSFFKIQFLMYLVCFLPSMFSLNECVVLTSLNWL